jgi:predicted ArsR family transcriptional regulator
VTHNCKGLFAQVSLRFYDRRMDATSITPTPHQLRALTHPVRLRMLGHLRLDGPATATTLAARLGLNTGATSYHLRQLAQHGFVVDDEERGTARERWWKAAHQSTEVDEPAPEDEDADHGLDAYLQTVAVVYTEMLQHAMEERPLLPTEWREASTFSDWVHRLTPRRAQAVIDALEATMADVDDEDDEDAVQFVVQLSAYVRPGQATQDRP